MLQDDARGGQSRVPAQIRFHGGSEPADMVAVARADVEGGLGEIVFPRDRLHGRFREPVIERANRSGISAENSAGKRVNLVDGEFHPLTLATDVTADAISENGAN